MRFPNMRKTLLIFLLLAYKLSFCSSETSIGGLRNEYQSNDLLISEVLFNPKTSGADFVEIYNPTLFSVSLNGISIGNIDDVGEVANIKSLGSGVIASGEYRVITKSTSSVMGDYYCPFANRFIEISMMPAYNNTSGHVILLRNDLIIDRLDYTEKMHIPILNVLKGVSLERVSFDRDANESGNFTSAAASVGFATPGYINSVQGNSELKHNELTLASKTFSPDADSFEDLLAISWQLKNYGNVATLNIYSDKGILIKRLLKNESVATSGTINWDGISEKGQLSSYGIYIVVFESFNIKGSNIKLKKAFALVGKL